jgi:hypothetical protein
MARQHRSIGRWLAARSSRASALVVGLAISAATFAFVAGANAQQSNVKVPSETVEVPARRVDFSGAQAAPAAPGIETVLPRPRVPGGYEALRQLRQKSPTSGSRGEPVPAKPQGALGAADPKSILANCTGPSGGSFAPSDVHGAVSPTSIVVVTNANLNAYNRNTCLSAGSVSLNALFGAVAGEQFFDPQVLWDSGTGRFIVTAESFVSGNLNQRQGWAISNDAAGTSYSVYTINIINGASFFCVPAANAFWDYPHVGSVNGVNPKWMITANIFPSGGGFFSNLLTFDKKPTLTGAPVTASCSTNFQGNLTPTAVHDDNNIAYLLSTGSGLGSAFKRYAYDTGLSTITVTPDIAITPWTLPPTDPPQPNGVTLDGIDGRFVSQTIQRGDYLWNTHSINVGGTWTAHVYQLSTTATAPLMVRQLFTAGDDHIFNASIAVNSHWAFVSTTRTLPSAGAPTGNAASVTFNGPNNLVPGWNFEIAATSAFQFTGCTACRWGDTSSTQIDPLDGSTAWAFNQIATGTTQFNWGTNISRHSGPIDWRLRTGHFNFNFPTDSKNDLLWRSNTGIVHFWLMNGLAAPLATVSTATVPLDWGIVGVGNFDGVGGADLLWRNVNGDVYMWLMNGTAISSQGSLGNVTRDWKVAATGDFNADGKRDILWRNYNGDVYVWFMNGLSVASQASLGNVSPAWWVESTGNFDGAGGQDIVWRHASGDVYVWLMNGSTISAQANLGNVSPNWSIVNVGDFNGDGKTDILWRNTVTGDVFIWLMNGTSILSQLPVGNVPLNWYIATAGDFDGDGRDDIIWRNTLDGNVQEWRMNSQTVLGTIGLGLIP